MNSTIHSSASLPTLSEILKENPGWLDEGIDTHEASKLTGYPVATLETMRTRGGGPVFFKRGRRVFYTRRTCLDWRETGRRTSTSDSDLVERA